MHTGKEWMIPKKYIQTIPDTIVFKKAVFVDTRNQNIATLEQEGDKWLVRSMNPATTGLHRPPYAQETPPGVYIIQEKKPRMIYLVDGTTETGGFAPYASRFTNGGYILGVPVNAPRKSLTNTVRRWEPLPAPICVSGMPLHMLNSSTTGHRFMRLLFLFSIKNSNFAV